MAVLKTSDIHDNLAKVLSLRKVREAAAGVIVTGPSRTADIEMALPRRRPRAGRTARLYRRVTVVSGQ